ncbi:hypothetical protein BDD12DRAFT_977877 [Trichophaea hybrida]|nr:hypothetical protein BDD12DRAFT_977877 [Trichophaea hybrida]
MYKRTIFVSYPDCGGKSAANLILAGSSICVSNINVHSQQFWPFARLQNPRIHTPSLPQHLCNLHQIPQPLVDPLHPFHPPQTPHISIDPYSPTRHTGENYKLLISTIVPRPIGFVSTVSPSGNHNLAPFSYFQVANHDPPIFTLGFSGETNKDTSQNLLDTKECTINIISESFVEAANYTSIDAPRGVSEWELSGLTKAGTEVVKPPRVLESVFSVEAKLRFSHEWESPRTGKKTGVLAVMEGVRFWVREDALVDGKMDLEVLRPVSRLGGVTYGRTTEVFELLRPRFEDEVKRGVVKGRGRGLMV